MSRALLGTVVEYPCTTCGEPVKVLAIADPEQVLNAAYGTGAARFFCAPCFPKDGA